MPPLTLHVWPASFLIPCAYRSMWPSTRQTPVLSKSSSSTRKTPLQWARIWLVLSLVARSQRLQERQKSPRRSLAPKLPNQNLLQSQNSQSHNLRPARARARNLRRLPRRLRNSLRRRASPNLPHRQALSQPLETARNAGYVFDIFNTSSTLSN